MSSAISSQAKRRFPKQLLAWFDRHKRDLPWRHDRDPYRVWISEIMLQQTRVAAVVDHYERFLRRFPTVEKLARAREASVLAFWSGLGYYRRARMLHQAAKQIVRAGKYPADAHGWQELPGVGRYTAAAIASIAFDQPVAVVDGNVERVLQRVSGKHLAGESRWELASEFLDRDRPGDFNQAMMELGATVCLPRQPKCLLCPVSACCATRGETAPRGTPARQQKRALHYALDCANGSVFLVKRAQDQTLMPDMWELPATNPSESAAPFTLRHSITVTDYTVHVLETSAHSTVNGRWIERTKVTRLPLTGLARKILRAAQVI